MMQSLLYALLRTTAWILIITGILFIILKAYLLGLPGLVIGGFLLWKTNGVIGALKHSNNYQVSPEKSTAYLSMCEINDPTSPHYVTDDANDADAESPFFLLHEHFTDPSNATNPAFDPDA